MQQNAELFAAEMAGMCVGVRVSRLHRHVTRRFEHVLRPLGISLPQLEVLSSLTTAGSGVAPGVLADWLALERSTMSRNLATLERAGLVTTVERSRTGRSMSVAITDHGRRTLVAAEQSWKEVNDELREALGDGAATMIETWLRDLGPPTSADGQTRRSFADDDT